MSALARQVAELAELRDALRLEVLEMDDALRGEVHELDAVLEPIRKAAHAAWFRGERDEWVRLGERAYQRARRRAMTFCPDCGRSMRTRHIPAHRRRIHGKAAA